MKHADVCRGGSLLAVARLQGVPHERTIGEGPRAQDRQAEGLRPVEHLEHLAAALGVRGADLRTRRLRIRIRIGGADDTLLYSRREATAGKRGKDEEHLCVWIEHAP